MRGCGESGGVSATDRSSPTGLPSRCTVVTTVGSPSRCWTTTVVPPPAAPAAKPSSSLSGVTEPSNPSRASVAWPTGDEVETTATAPVSPTSSTWRTCRSAGVKTAPSTARCRVLRLVEAMDHATVVEPPRHSRQQVDPGVVGDRSHQRRRAAVEVDLAQLQPLLVSGQQRQHRRRPAPLDIRQVLEDVAVDERVGAPADVRTLARQADHGERDERVGRPRLGVADCSGLGAGTGRVGDVPDGDGRLVVPLHQQGLAIRRPPEATATVQLLGGRELRETPPHLGRLTVIRADEQAVVAVHVHDVHPVLTGVRHKATGRVELRVDHRRRRRKLTWLAVGEVDHVEPRRERERRPRDLPVGAERHDSRAPHPHPFPARALLRR